jgi:hypothetical protein
VLLEDWNDRRGPAIPVWGLRAAGKHQPVQGYEVIGSDGHKLGEVVDVEDDLVVVEGGHLRKSRHAIPKAFAHAVDDERVVRLTVSKDLVQDSPAIKNGDFDHVEVARHYGLADGYDDPETLGDGELLPDDPARSAEHEGLRSTVEPEAERRARIREGRDEAPPRGRQIIPSDPHEGP